MSKTANSSWETTGKPIVADRHLSDRQPAAGSGERHDRPLSRRTPAAPRWLLMSA